jgi:hypothetical protein
MGDGRWEMGAGSWELGAGSWELGAGSWELGAGSWELGAGSWELGEPPVAGFRVKADRVKKKLRSQSLMSHGSVRAGI